MVKVIGVGDCMVDKNLTTGMMYPGGQALNIAVNTKLCGAQSAFIGAFGDDYIADHMKKTMDEIGIDYSHSHFYHAPNAFARYKVIDNDRVFQRSPNGRYNPLQGAIRRMLAYEGFSQEDIAYIKGFDVMHTSNGAFIEEYLPELAGEGIKISYDFSLDHMREGVMEKVCPYSYFVLLSCSHMTTTEMQEQLIKAHTLGAKICIGTRGSEGSTCYDGDQFYTQAPHWKEHVVDTMGAGDAFVSAFLYDFIGHDGYHAKDKSEIIKHALDFAAEYSANSCMIEGSFGHGAPYLSEE